MTERATPGQGLGAGRGLCFQTGPGAGCGRRVAQLVRTRGVIDDTFATAPGQFEHRLSRAISQLMITSFARARRPTRGPHAAFIAVVNRWAPAGDPAIRLPASMRG
jgi:hypothetical protein